MYSLFVREASCLQTLFARNRLYYFTCKCSLLFICSVQLCILLLELPPTYFLAPMQLLQWAKSKRCRLISQQELLVPTHSCAHGDRLTKQRYIK